MSNRLEETVNHLVTIVQTIDSRLMELESKVDSRLHDTRPNLEAIQSQLTALIDSQDNLREEMSGVPDQLQSIRNDVSGIGNEVSGIGNEVSGLGNEVSGIANEVSGIANEVSGIKSDLASLRAETEKGFRTIDRRMERQIGEFERLHAYQRDLEDRVDKIEKQLSS
jgi:predicted  nucleic acid-binding Zn-ribbon protein